MLTCNVRDILRCFKMLYPSLDHCKCLPNSCTSVKQTLLRSDGQGFFLRFHIRQHKKERGKVNAFWLISCFTSEVM